MRGAALRLAKINNVDVSSIRGRPVVLYDIDINICIYEDNDGIVIIS